MLDEREFADSRRGRAMKKAGLPGNRVVLSMRVEPAIKEKLEKLAALSGRSMALEAERVLEAALSDDALGGDEVRPMLLRMASAARGIISEHGAPPSKSLETYHALRKALTAIMNSELRMPNDPDVELFYESMRKLSEHERAINTYVREKIKPLENMDPPQPSPKTTNSFLNAGAKGLAGYVAAAAAQEDPEADLIRLLYGAPLPSALDIDFRLRNIDPRSARNDVRDYFTLLDMSRVKDEAFEDAQRFHQKIQARTKQGETAGIEYLKKLRMDEGAN